MTQMTAEEFLQKVQEFTGNKTTFDPKNVEEFQKSIRSFTENLKKSQPGLAQFKDFLNGTTKPIEDVTKQMDALNRAIKEAKEAKNIERTASLEDQKSDLTKAAISKNLVAGFTNLGIGVASLTNGVYEGTRDFVKSLQSGAGGVEVATQTAVKTAKLAGETGKALGGFVQSMGFVVSLLGGPWVKALGLAVSAIGAFTEWFSGKAADKAADAAQLLGDELKKTEKGFKDITGAGAIFAGGMTEMRVQAGRAGLDIAMLAEVVKSSREDLVMMGIGMGEATKRVAGVSKELRNSELGMQLRKLGYSAEEQASLSAQVMANMNAAGDKRIMTDAELARVTAQYGKDLKILSDITGQDAKKLMEKARTESLKADILAKLTPEQAERFQAQVANMPATAHKALFELISSGGTAITDIASNVMMQESPAFAKTIQDGYTNIFSNKNVEEVTAEAQAQRGRFGDELRSMRGTGTDMIATADRLGQGNDGILRSVTEMKNNAILETQVGEEAIKNAQKNATAAANNQATLDVSIHTLNKQTLALQAALGPALTDAITGFANKSASALGILDDALAKFGITKNTSNGTPTSQVTGGKQIDKQAVGRLGSIVRPDGTSYNPYLQNQQSGTPFSGGNKPTSAGSDVIDYGNLQFKNKAEGTGGGNVDAQIIRAAQIISNKYDGTVVNGFNDLEHWKPEHKTSKHRIGAAADLRVPGFDKPGTMDAINSLISGLGVSAAIHNGDHVHLEEMQKAIGGTVGSGQTAIVGEKGAELVNGPASVTSTASTSQIFNNMLDKLDEMVSVLKDNRDYSEKILHATQ